jgi:hypothetical protein
MAIKALNLSAVRVYESRYDPDRGTKDASRFTIGALDSRTSGRIRDQATRFVVDPNAADEEVETVINTSEVNYQRVQYGLKGFENFRDDQDNDIEFRTQIKRHGSVPYTIVSDATMKLIPDALITELADEIVRGNELTATEAKNSVKP